MAAALTFGSIGDIIAVCQLAVQLGHALSDAAGSARQYQDLRTDLDTFVNILMQVVATYEQRELSPWMAGLDTATKAVVDECAVLIQKSLDRLNARYGEALLPGGSGSILKDAYKKVEFSVLEKEKLSLLQGKLQKNTERLTLLAGLAAHKSARVDNATMLARIEHVDESLSKHRENQEELLELHLQHTRLIKNQSCQLDIIDGRLKSQEMISWTIVGSVRNTFSAIVTIQETLRKVADAVMHLQALPSASGMLRTLDPTFGKPVVLEDALGNILEVPLDWIHGWEMFHILLQHRFENLKGHELVQARQYALEENCTGRDMDVAQPWSLAFRPGMKINMSMIFQDFSDLHGACPRCKKLSEAPRDTTVQCLNRDCNMWFRVLRTEGVEHDYEPPFYSDQQTGDLNSVYPGELILPSDFQRVRLIERVYTAALEATTGLDLSPGPHICAECGRSFEHVHELMHHERYHSPPYECHHCDKVCSTKTYLDRHINYWHPKPSNGVQRVQRSPLNRCNRLDRLSCGAPTHLQGHQRLFTGSSYSSKLWLGRLDSQAM